MSPATRRALAHLATLACAASIVAACADPDGPTSAPDRADADPTPDATPDTSDATRDASDAADAPVDVPDDALLFIAPRVDPAGGLWPLLVHAVDADGAIDPARTGRIAIEVTVAGQPRAVEVWLRRGVGSVTLEVPPGASVSIAARTFDAAPVATRRLSGPLTGDDLRWGPDETIELTADATVPPGATLVIAPGTVVRADPAVNLDVDGAVEALGEPGAPILMGPGDGGPWGGVRLAGRGVWRSVFFVGGGEDAARVFGHSNSQPVLFASPGTSLELDAVVIQDGPGKALGAQRARIALRDSLITRTDTGGELERTALTATRSWFLDFPSIGAAYQDDDNDGIYLKDALEEGGAPVPSVLEDCVFMFGLDDGVDHNGATLELRRLWIEGFTHEGLATSTGGTVAITDSVVTGCEQGIEAGYGAPDLIADHLLLMDNGVGARYGDSYDWEVSGTLTVRDTVFLGNREQAVRDLVLLTGAPGPPGAVTLDRCLLDDAAAPEGQGNVTGTALLTDTLLLDAPSPGRGIASDGDDPGLQTGRPR